MASHRLLPLLLSALLGAHLDAPAGQADVRMQVDWPVFLGRHDMRWDRLPQRSQDAPWFGNGDIGSMIWKDGNANRLLIPLFSSSAQDHRSLDYGVAAFSRSRLPIGSFIVQPKGKITGCDWRLDLWNAELRGTVLTDQGTLTIHHFAHATRPIVYTSITSTGNESCTWTWNPGDGRPPATDLPVDEKMVQAARTKYRSSFPIKVYDPNPAPVMESVRKINLCKQALQNEGQLATAWKILERNSNTRRQEHVASVVCTLGDRSAGERAMKAVQDVSDRFDLGAWKKQHRDWWHSYFQKSFVALSHDQAECFYWTQVYQMGATSRGHGRIIDTAGLWHTSKASYLAKWNGDTQSAYYPFLTSNRIQEGSSLINRMWARRQALRDNVRPQEWQKDSSAIFLATGQDLAGPRDMDQRPVAQTIGNLTWALQYGWLQTRYTRDDNTMRKKVLPLLKRSVNYALHQLVERDDGLLHLPRSFSPGIGLVDDASYELALLRWGLATLINESARLTPKDRLLPKWKQTLERLPEFVVDAQDGFMPGKGTPLDKPVAHPSHLMMIWPLRLLDLQQPSQVEMARKSIDHWIQFPAKRKRQGNSRSRVVAANMFATLGDGERAWLQAREFFRSPNLLPAGRFEIVRPKVHPPLLLASAFQDMLCQSWGGEIRIFPAMPREWQRATFHRFLAEGAFIVSASWDAGSTSWIRIESKAGDPCIVRTNMRNPDAILQNGNSLKLEPLSGDRFSVPLKRGQVCLIHPKTTITGPRPVVRPIHDAPVHWHGLNRYRDAALRLLRIP